MDHLPAVARRPEVIPYLATGGYEYDQGGFYGYPGRRGLDILKIFDHGTHELEEEALNSFAQAWLFFGVLGEFSSSGNKEVSLQKFHKTDAHSRLLLTTEYLMEYIEDWRTYMTHMPESERVARQMITVVLLNDVKQIVVKYCSTPVGLFRSVWQIQPRIALSLMVLGETLCWALDRLQEDCSPATGWNGYDRYGWGNSKFVTDRLEQRRWCPHSVYMLQGLLKGSVSGLYYASTFPDSPDYRQNRSHRMCKAEQCMANDIVEHGYQPKHVEIDCNCQYVGPNTIRVLEVLENGKFPLFRYTGSSKADTGQITVDNYSPGMKYVVISHVWADGLGNPQGNAMVSCQLERLTKLIKQLLNLSGGPLYFWIDSIAVPVSSRRHRQIAIQQMHRVYELAYKTIVLDGDLMRNPLGFDYMETAMRITISGWMQRLWTLQEGVMSRSIHFLFEDGLKDIDELDLIYAEAAKKSSVAEAARSFYVNLLRPYAPTKQANAMRAGAIWKAVQWRTTTKNSDEVFALARILDINPEALVKCLPEERMLVLIGNMQEIPPAFIFLPGRRLKVPGFRWAPETWMVRREIEYPDPLSLPCHGTFPILKGNTTCNALSILKPNGLVVRFPGFLLHCQRSTPVTLFRFIEETRFADISFPSNDSLQEWYSFRLEKNSASDNSSWTISEGETLAIILCRPKPGPTPEIALLVATFRQHGEEQVQGYTIGSQGRQARVICRIEINTKPQNSHRVLQQDWREGPELYLSGEELSSDQVWVVD